MPEQLKRTPMDMLLTQMQELRDNLGKDLGETSTAGVMAGVTVVQRTLDLFLKNKKILLENEQVHFLNAFLSGRLTRESFNEYFSGRYIVDNF